MFLLTKTKRPQKHKCNVIEEEKTKIKFCTICGETVDISMTRQINIEHKS